MQVCEEPNAISLASSDAQGRPSVRVVLLKGFDERGFVFYTNYDSRKGRELMATGAAAFSVYWEALQRQVKVPAASAWHTGSSYLVFYGRRTWYSTVVVSDILRAVVPGTCVVFPVFYRYPVPAFYPGRRTQ